ncbi:MAG: thioesterase family protein [Rhizobiaceae bacterium]|nr:thioesterase family protein [Rhizobiaceae bacterium]
MNAMQPVPAPFIGFEGAVEDGWIDVNGHMNVAWYDRVFDIAESNLFEAFGICEAYTLRTNCGTFRVEKRMRYERELMPGDRLRVESRIAATDDRVLRGTHEIVNMTRGGRAAIAECVSLHVDLAVRRSARITDPLVLEPLTRMSAEHSRLPPVISGR